MVTRSDLYMEEQFQRGAVPMVWSEDVTRDDTDLSAPGRADLHTHTHYSGFNKVSFIPFPESVTSPRKMVDTAVKKNLDILCITDHNEIAGAWKAQRYVQEKSLDIDVVAGEEIKTADGEVLGLFLQERIPQGLSAAETVDIIHGQGGLAVAPHPFSYRCFSLGKKIGELCLDGVEVLNAAHRDPYVNGLALITAGSCVALTGGSDAHSPVMLGDACTEFPGESAEDLYRAIRRRETYPGGGPAPMRHWIFWTIEVAHGVFMKLIARPPHEEEEDIRGDPLERVNQMRRHNKLIAIGGCMAFMVTPLPLVCGIIGEGWLRWQGRKKWEEVFSEWIIPSKL
jgi:predicted metal-dependent phosphoesterase TrpH